jgi:hypothetical protein
MNSETRRPAAPGGAHRAAGLEFLGGTSNPRNSTTDPQKLAAASIDVLRERRTNKNLPR